MAQRRRAELNSSPELTNVSTGASKPPAKLLIDGPRLLVRDKNLFAQGDAAARDLVDRVFAAAEVRAVVLRRDRAQLRIELSPLADPAEVWPRVGRLLREGAPERRRAQALNLAGPAPGLSVRVSRAGDALTTFRVRRLARESLRIGHPLLRRRDILHRFGLLLESIHGVDGVKLTGIAASAVITYDPERVSPEQVLRLLESSWENVLFGPQPPEPPKKLVAAGALLAFSFYAQFLNPAALPFAVAAVLVFSAPNVIAAVRDLAWGRVGVSALYTAGLGFLLYTGLPFASSVMSVLRQTWPNLSNWLAARSERTLFAEQRRRLAWARRADGAVVDLGELGEGQLAQVRRGEFIPADGVVVEGLALVEEDALTGARPSVDKAPGDPVYAGTFVREGELTFRATRVGPKTVAAALAQALPHGALKNLPSSHEAERIANRNAKPSLLLSAALLALTRTPRLAQVALRPDFVSAPRLSAHLSGLTALSETFSQGVLARRPAALERLLSADLYVLDDSLDFAARTPEVAEVVAPSRAAGQEAALLAAAALAGLRDTRLEALERRVPFAPHRAHGRRHHAGAISFWDEDGAGVIVGSPAYAAREGFKGASAQVGKAVAALARTERDPAARPLVVARDGKIIGLIRFAAEGGSRLAAAVAHLRTADPEARFVNISSLPQDHAEARAKNLGLDAVFGDLDAAGKIEAIKSLSPRTLWIGNGADPDAASARDAAFVSLSLGGLDRLGADRADLVALRGELEALAAARLAARRHQARLRADYRIVYAANLLALAGGVFAGFGSLRAGLTSNVGAGLVFLARLRTLRAAGEEAARAASRRALPALPPAARHV